MNKFFFFVFKIIAAIVVLAFLLDFIYSKSFCQSKQRDKIGCIYNSKPQEFDVVILGSSRANNHFVTEMFTNKGLTAFNFGMQGSKLFESNLVLKLLLEKKNKIKNVIIDVDLNLRTNKRSDAVTLKFLPYLYGSDVIKNQLMVLPDYNLLYYIPFYRYTKFGSKIGFREMFFSSIDKKSKELDFGGYSALSNSNNPLHENLEVNPIRSKYYEEIKAICKKNNINLIAIMTPVCEDVIGIDYFSKVKKLYPEIHNYENAVVENKYFFSCGHMNDTGARIFTTKILKDFFNK